MRKMFGAVIVVGVAFITAGVPRVSGQGRSIDSMEDLIGEATAFFEESGFDLFGSRRTGDAEAGGIAREEIGLHAGRTYAILGVCDVDCSDLHLRLLGPDGASVSEDNTGGIHPVVAVAPETSDIFAVEVSMVRCAAATCGWAVQAYAGGGR